MDKIRGFTCYANIDVTEVIPLSITAGKGLLFDKIKERNIFLVNSARTNDKSY